MVFKCEEKKQIEKYLTYEQMNILISAQRLWIGLTSWLRVYTRAVIYNNIPDNNYVTDLLIEFPEEFYKLFSIFYGGEVGHKIKNLILNFVKAAFAVTEIIMLGDKVTESFRITEWYKVADKLALGLAETNVYWDIEQWRFLLYRYIRIKIDETHMIATGNYEGAQKIYDELRETNYIIGNYLGRGIITSAV